MRKLTISLIIPIVCELFAFSQQPQRSDALRHIIPGHYMFASSTYTSGVIATNEGVIVLDSLNSEAVGRAERRAIEDTIRQPFAFWFLLLSITTIRRATWPMRMSPLRGQAAMQAEKPADNGFS
jgi:hypothetical protein